MKAINFIWRFSNRESNGFQWLTSSLNDEFLKFGYGTGSTLRNVENSFDLPWNQCYVMRCLLWLRKVGKSISWKYTVHELTCQVFTDLFWCDPLFMVRRYAQVFKHFSLCAVDQWKFYLPTTKNQLRWLSYQRSFVSLTLRDVAETSCTTKTKLLICLDALLNRIEEAIMSNWQEWNVSSQVTHTFFGFRHAFPHCIHRFSINEEEVSLFLIRMCSIRIMRLKLSKC